MPARRDAVPGVRNYDPRGRGPSMAGYPIRIASSEFGGWVKVSLAP